MNRSRPDPSVIMRMRESWAGGTKALTAAMELGILDGKAWSAWATGRRNGRRAPAKISGRS